MTDRLKGCVVVFAEDVREDDASPLLQAIGQLRGVLSVEPSVLTGDDWMARERIRAELHDTLWSVLRH